MCLRRIAPTSWRLSSSTVIQEAMNYPMSRKLTIFALIHRTLVTFQLLIENLMFCHRRKLVVSFCYMQSEVKEKGNPPQDIYSKSAYASLSWRVKRGNSSRTRCKTPS